MIDGDRLRALIAQGESFEVEFKADRPSKLSDGDLVEAAVCLANGRGGTIALGVENDGVISGLHDGRGTPPTPEHVEALIANRTVPPLTVRCDIIGIDGQLVASIEVPQSQYPVGTSEGKYKRRGWGGDNRPACLPFPMHEMVSRLSSFGALDITARPLAQATWADLDALEFARVRAAIAKSGDTTLTNLGDQDLIRALGLGRSAEGAVELTIGAILVFGREASVRRFIPTHGVAFQVLDGQRVLANEFFYGPLVQIAEAVALRFDARWREQEIDIGPVRAAVPNFSRVGFREALHNALLHRDYMRHGTVTIQWRTDGMEISSPGGFVEGISLATLLSVGQRPRNPALADALKRIGLVERTGRGIPRMFEQQLLYGRSAPDYSLTTSSEVRVILPGGDANLGLTRYLLELRGGGTTLRAEELLAINTVERERRIDAERLAILVGRNREAAVAILERLVEAGALEGHGDGPRRSYLLSAAAFGSLGDHAEYARAVGFASIQQEQMVLRYLLSHDRITRREVARLCQIDNEDARKLVGRLHGRGDLVLHGEKRGSYYTIEPAVKRTLKDSAKSAPKRRQK